MAQQLQTTAGAQTLTPEFHPATTSPVKGAVVIAYGSDGLTEDLNGPWATMIRDYADNLAGLGFQVSFPTTSASPTPALASKLWS